MIFVKLNLFNREHKQFLVLAVTVLHFMKQLHGKLITILYSVYIICILIFIVLFDFNDGDFAYKKIVIERTRDLIYLKFVATDFFPIIISPSAGKNFGDSA